MTAERSSRVADRLDSALLALQANPSLAPAGNISALCRLANISRSNLYANYPELIARLRAKPGKMRATKKAASSVKVVRGRKGSGWQEVQALRYICAELLAELQRAQIEIAALTNEINTLRARRK